jgi:hypothetical protein
LVDHGVLLRDGRQFAEIVLWCNSRDQCGVLVAAARQAQPAKLTIRGSLESNVLQAMGNLLANSGATRVLALTLECTASEFGYLMRAIGANARIESLTVSKPAAVDIDVWCSAVGQALDSSRSLRIALELPEELQAQPAVRELVDAGAGRVGFAG